MNYHHGKYFLLMLLIFSKKTARQGSERAKSKKSAVGVPKYSAN
jgi:hypothetical protein